MHACVCVCVSEQSVPRTSTKLAPPLGVAGMDRRRNDRIVCVDRKRQSPGPYIMVGRINTTCTLLAFPIAYIACHSRRHEPMRQPTLSLAGSVCMAYQCLLFSNNFRLVVWPALDNLGAIRRVVVGHIGALVAASNDTRCRCNDNARYP
jgi:hypothetical protein